VLQDLIKDNLHFDIRVRVRWPMGSSSSGEWESWRTQKAKRGHVNCGCAVQVHDGSPQSAVLDRSRLFTTNVTTLDVFTTRSFIFIPTQA